MYTRLSWRLLALLAVSWVAPSPVVAEETAGAAPLAKPSIIYKLRAPDERVDMVIHGSRILATDDKIVQIEPGNRDILDVTTLSPNQVQVTAKAIGVTEVNLWDENKKLYSVSVLVVGDTRELTMLLKSLFPDCPLKVTPVKDSVMISGYVDKAEYIDRIILIAKEFYPNVINGMTVGGCQQVLLHVKIMEVSRTKLRQLGFDWAKITGANVITSNPSGLLSNAFDSTPVTPTMPPQPPKPWSPTVTTGGGGLLSFGIANGASAFFGVLDALREDNLAKILAEPTLTASSGSKASFRAGGFFWIIPNGQNGGAPQQVKYGTQLDFMPIVLGNGRIHLDVQSTISEPDPSQPQDFQPAVKDRLAGTTAELQAGQTLAIAGLVQSRIEAANRGLPWISDVPYLGAAFRRVQEKRNEVELLIMITPELVEPLDACEVPPCGPGMATTSPSDWELYFKGHLEVPKCPPGPCGNGNGCENGSGNAGPNGADRPDGPPSDGMIGSQEQVPTPPPTNGSARSKPQSRHSPTKPNSATSTSPSESPDGPPGLIGPAGYDVVK
jgi:pilus assembly protein CpaC